jgi:hypothetical protein
VQQYIDDIEQEEPNFPNQSTNSSQSTTIFFPDNRERYGVTVASILHLFRILPAMRWLDETSLGLISRRRALEYDIARFSSIARLAQTQRAADQSNGEAIKCVLGAISEMKAFQPK